MRLPSLPVWVLVLSLPFAATAEEALTEQKDIPFLGPDRREHMDAYLPPASFQRPRPAVIYIHGGGWHGGSRGDARAQEFCRALAGQGYAAFSIDYLLNTIRKEPDGKTTITSVAWPQNFIDSKTAVRFIRKYADAYGIDPDRIAVMGASAGAHLAMLVAATKDDPAWNQRGLYPEESNEIAAVIQFYGRFDVTRDRRPQFAGTTPEETEANVVAASPATHLTARMPPVLAIQGEDDKVVPVSYGRRLVERLQALGVPHEYIEIPGAGHSFGLTLPQKDLRPAFFAFLEKHLAAPAP